ncbi:hypothetical protein C8F01DRAFT_1230725 [Mycena amicta]|nr:hypothetical protein C8F01DRAFT_1230725 [Mycena amicta]
MSTGSETDSETYSRLLFSQKLGYPLFRPCLSQDVLPERRSAGVQIGDVGVVTTDGAFDPIFNILDHRLNSVALPEVFESPQLPHGALLREEPAFYPANHEISNRDVRARALSLQGAFDAMQLGVPAGGKAKIDYSAHTTHIAHLKLPSGGSLSEHRSLKTLEDCARRNAPHWYSFVRDKLGRKIDFGDLYLVTQIRQAPSCTISIGKQSSGERLLSFGAKGAGVGSINVSGNWNHETGPAIADGTPLEKMRVLSYPTASSTKEEGTFNEKPTEMQTIFFSGFKIMLGVDARLNLMGKPKDIGAGEINWSEAKKGGKSFWRSFIHAILSCFCLRRSKAMAEPPPSPPKIPEADQTKQDTPTAKISNHPSDAINESILASQPGTSVAVTHDCIWAAVLKDGEDMPPYDDLVKRVQDEFTFSPADDQGASSPRPRKPGEMLETLAEAQTERERTKMAVTKLSIQPADSRLKTFPVQVTPVDDSALPLTPASGGPSIVPTLTGTPIKEKVQVVAEPVLPPDSDDLSRNQEAILGSNIVDTGEKYPLETLLSPSPVAAYPESTSPDVSSAEVEAAAYSLDLNGVNDDAVDVPLSPSPPPVVPSNGGSLDEDSSVMSNGRSTPMAEARTHGRGSRTASETSNAEPSRNANDPSSTPEPVDDETKAMSSSDPVHSRVEDYFTAGAPSSESAGHPPLALSAEEGNNSVTGILVESPVEGSDNPPSLVPDSSTVEKSPYEKVAEDDVRENPWDVAPEYWCRIAKWPTVNAKDWPLHKKICGKDPKSRNIASPYGMIISREGRVQPVSCGTEAWFAPMFGFTPDKPTKVYEEIVDAYRMLGLRAHLNASRVPAALEKMDFSEWMSRLSAGGVLPEWWDVEVNGAGLDKYTKEDAWGRLDRIVSEEEFTRRANTKQGQHLMRLGMLLESVVYQDLAWVSSESMFRNPDAFSG